MKVNQDSEQQILDAMDSPSEMADENMEALLDSEEGLDFLCDINDLDEAANRKWGVVPDVDSAWAKFDARKASEDKKAEADEDEDKSARIYHLVRYAITGVAAVVAIVFLMTWHQSQGGKQKVAKAEVENVGSTSDSQMDLAQTAVPSDVAYQTITIEAGEQKTVTLPDGTEVCLNAKSILKYPENFGKDNRNVEFYGEGYFKVHHDASLPFIIKTKTVSTKVLGTEFNLRCYNNEDVHVTLVQGSVEVSLNQEHVKISPRQDAYINKDKLAVQNVNPKDFTSWKDGVLYFDNASLRTILQQLGRIYDVNVVCRDEDLLNKHFHYMCNIKDSLENALKQLNATSEVNVKLKNNVIVIE